MFWWVDRLAFAMALLAPLGQDSGIERVYREVQSSLAYVLDNERRIGVLAMVDEQGTFIGHSRLAGGLEIDVSLADGRRLKLRFKADDSVTGLSAWVSSRGPIPGMRPLALVRNHLAPGAMLVGLVPSGPFRAQLASVERVGVVGPGRQVVELSEIWFEAPSSEPVAGALLVTPSGQLFGILGATLASTSEPGFVGTVGRRLGPKPELPNRLGPTKLTVAFAVGREPLRAAVEGLVSPLGRVERPALGVLCRDDPSGGALVEGVKPGSAAERAGLQPGDVILEIADQPVRNQIGFARAISSHRVGDRVKVKVRRGSVVTELWAILERS